MAPGPGRSPRGHLLLLLVRFLLVLLCQAMPGQDGLLVAELALQPPALFSCQLLLPVLGLHPLLPLQELREVSGPIHKPVDPGGEAIQAQPSFLCLVPHPRPLRGTGVAWPPGTFTLTAHATPP